MRTTRHGEKCLKSYKIPRQRLWMSIKLQSLLASYRTASVNVVLLAKHHRRLSVEDSCPDACSWPASSEILGQIKSNLLASIELALANECPFRVPSPRLQLNRHPQRVCRVGGFGGKGRQGAFKINPLASFRIFLNATRGVFRNYIR